MTGTSVRSNSWPLEQKCCSKTFLHILLWNLSVQFSREYLSPCFHKYVLSTAVWSLENRLNISICRDTPFEHDRKTLISKCFSGKGTLWNVRISLDDTWLWDHQISHSSRKSRPTHGSSMLSSLRKLPRFTSAAYQDKQQIAAFLWGSPGRECFHLHLLAEPCLIQQSQRI